MAGLAFIKTHGLGNDFVFVAARAVSWPRAFVMMAGGLIGGFAGGKLGNWLPADRARMIVTAVARC
jgi:uncharacterized membrane protein YfcA